MTATSGSLAPSAGVEVFEISSDWDVLRLLYRTTGGDGWREKTNWLTDAPLSEWAGVTTYNNGRVRYLELRDNGLDGPIPRSLGQLDQLFILTLAGNSLSGRIPPEIGRLPALRSLGLCESSLSGPIPPETGEIRTLESLSLCHGPGLGGLLPRALMQLGSLSESLYYGTGLCPQIDSDFRAWLIEVQAQGEECGPAETERLALGAFFAGTGGNGWTRSTGWRSGAALDDWHGVTTGGGRVRELALPANGLRAPSRRRSRT